MNVIGVLLWQGVIADSGDAVIVTAALLHLAQLPGCQACQAQKKDKYSGDAVIIAAALLHLAQLPCCQA